MGPTDTRPDPARRRVALVAYYYPPLGGAGSQRALSFAAHLPAHGWDVSVFSPAGGVYGSDPSAVGDGIAGVEVTRTGTLEPRVLFRSLLQPVSGGEEAGTDIEGARVGSLGAALRSAVRRTLYFPDSARFWGPHLKSALRREHGVRPFDVVLSSSPPFSAHVAALSFGRRAGVPVVLDFRDILHEVVAEPRGRHARLLERVLPGASRATTVSGACREWLAQRSGGVTVDVVWNGFEDPPGEAASPTDPEPGNYIAYAGTVYDPDRQDLSPLLRSLRALRAEGSKLVLRIAGRVYPGARELLDPFAKEGLLEYAGFLPSAGIPGFLRASRANVVWAWETPGIIGMSQAPVKLFDALPLRRPILLACLPGSEAEAVGIEVGLKVHRHGDEAGMTAALRECGRGFVPQGWIPSAEKAARFARKSQAAVLASILAEVAAHGGAASDDRGRRGQ